MGKRIVSYEIETPFPDDITPRVLKAMNEDGMSLRALAEKYKVSRETVRLEIKKVKDVIPT
jgi:transposase